MVVHQLYLENSLRNFSYLIEASSKDIILIDPYDTKLLQDYLDSKGLTPTMIICTHEHVDHIGSNSYWIDRYGIPIYLHPDIAVKNGHDHVVGDLEELIFGETTIQFIYSPGHTPSSIVLKVMSGEKDCIITGDTIFNGGVGNCKSGNPRDLFKTVSSLMKNHMSPTTVIYPGHDYLETNLKFTLSIDGENSAAIKLSENVKDQKSMSFKDEYKINLFMQCKDLRIQKLLNVKSEEEAFLKLRRLRDNW